MTTAVVCILCIAMIVVGCMTISHGFMSSADVTAMSTQEMSIRQGDINRTRLTGVNATLPSAGILEAFIENSGQTKLASFDKWDAIVQYYDSDDHYYVKWLPYQSDILGDNEWSKTGIYFNNHPEVFEPGILNPQEQLGFKAALNPSAGYRAIDITISTPNGIAPTIVCGPPFLTAHTETVSAGGANFYMLKGWTAADGDGITDTTNRISANETGRWMLHNSLDASATAQHLFPLSGVSRLTAAKWTVNYHGRADGWLDGTLGNAYLSIDVVIRKADGSIREVLDSDAAQAGFPLSNDWVDISGIYNFPGYIVVDNTDYLEIDFYGVSDNDGPSEPSYLKLAIDDKSLPESSQTGVKDIGWD
jgi:flagellar protein FlaF